LTGGGTIAATRTIDLDISGLTADSIASGDQIAFYDITGSHHNKITVSGLNGVLDHDSLSGFVANEHIDHSSVSVTAGTGLSGGGTIAATRTLDVDINGLSADGSPDGGTDYVMTYDDSASTLKKVLLDNLPGGGGDAFTTVDCDQGTDPIASGSDTLVLTSTDLTITGDSSADSVTFAANTTIICTLTAEQLLTTKTLQYPILSNSASDPSPSNLGDGMLYYNSNDHEVKAYIDGTWTDLLGTTSFTTVEGNYGADQTITSKWRFSHAQPAVEIYRDSGTTADGPQIDFIRYDGGTSLTTDDYLGYQQFYGHDGTSSYIGSAILVRASENVAPSAHGSYLSLYATPSSSTTLTEMIRVGGGTYNEIYFDTGSGEGIKFECDYSGGGTRIVADAEFQITSPTSVHLVCSGTLGTNTYCASSHSFKGYTCSNSTTVNVDGTLKASTIIGTVLFNQTAHSDTPTTAPALEYIRSRGTESTPTAIQDGDDIAFVDWKGHDGTDYYTGFKLDVEADGIWSGSNRGSIAIFKVVPNSTITALEIFRLGKVSNAPGMMMANANKLAFGEEENYIAWDSISEVQYNAKTAYTHAFKINQTDEVTISANYMTFNNGSNDTRLNWATNGELSLDYGTNAEFTVKSGECEVDGDLYVGGGLRVVGDIGSGLAGTLTITDKSASVSGTGATLAGTGGKDGPTSDAQAKWIKVFDGTTASWIALWT